MISMVFLIDIGPGSKLGTHIYKQSGIPGEKRPSKLLFNTVCWLQGELLAQATLFERQNPTFVKLYLCLKRLIVFGGSDPLGIYSHFISDAVLRKLMLLIIVVICKWIINNSCILITCKWLLAINRYNQKLPFI